MSYEKWMRRVAAPVSIVMCVGLILSVYSQEYGQGYEEPPLLNTTFRYWTLVPGTNETKPYLWEADFLKGPGDLLWITQDTVEGESALAMHAYQDGLNDTFDWAMLHVRQDLRGRAAAKVFQNDIGVWVYPTFPYRLDPVNSNPRNAFGIEINDGTHILWFIFSTGAPALYEFRLHRIVVIPTPLNQWSYRVVSVKAEYEEAKWPTPDSFSFILIAGATKLDPGQHDSYFRSVTVTEQSTPSTEFPAVPSRIASCISILALHEPVFRASRALRPENHHAWVA